MEWIYGPLHSYSRPLLRPHTPRLTRRNCFSQILFRSPTLFPIQPVHDGKKVNAQNSSFKPYQQPLPDFIFATGCFVAPGQGRWRVFFNSSVLEIELVAMASSKVCRICVVPGLGPTAPPPQCLLSNQAPQYMVGFMLKVNPRTGNPALVAAPDSSPLSFVHDANFWSGKPTTSLANKLAVSPPRTGPSPLEQSRYAAKIDE